MLAKLARLNAPRVAARAAAPRALFSSDSVVDTITLTQKRSAVLRNASDADLEATKKAIANEQKRRQSTLIIGAAGAVGKRLCAALTQAGHKVIATDRTPVLPKDLRDSIGEKGICIGSVDVTDAEGLVKLFEEHADANTSVWNLAAPLSVDTALNPAIAEAITIGGMKNVLAAMAKDPGSDYGLQKRGCRELMADFAKKHNGDPRFAVLPGVLHSNSVWGNGTTEYALDALLSAPHQATTLGLPTGESYTCPVDPDVRMPMVFVDDLMRGLVALQEAEPDVLAEPENGYCIPGLSFSANELFSEIRKHYPGFGFRVQLDANMDKFAKLWPDELATEEPLRDLGYKPEVGLEEMVATHAKAGAAAGRAGGSCQGSGAKA
ncbi:L-threonine 3-dehydrogenase [Aureococcus anophagefferens]|nr:L-threonine 3-dehydrogenase [Aureococcus anophagefferens]